MGRGALSSGNPWLITQAGKNSGRVPPYHLLAPAEILWERRQR